MMTFNEREVEHTDEEDNKLCLKYKNDEEKVLV